MSYQQSKYRTLEQLVDDLPRSGRWTIEQRTRWLRAVVAVLDVLTSVVSETAPPDQIDWLDGDQATWHHPALTWVRNGQVWHLVASAVNPYWSLCGIRPAHGSGWELQEQQGARLPTLPTEQGACEGCRRVAQAEYSVAAEK